MSAKLSDAKRRAVHALAAGLSYDAAARAAGVTARTLRRWRNEPGFAHELRLADSESLAHTARVLNAASRSAVEVLQGILEDERASPTLKIRAASEVLRHRSAFYELTTLTDRITELEERMAA